MFVQKKSAIAVWQALSIGISMTAAAAVHAQTATTEKTVITGSNIKRIETETALPITVVTKEEILRTGTTTAAELLDRISANSSFGNYTTAIAAGDAARPGYAAASLRGLGANKTLILLNGRRITNYALDTGGGAVDLNSIPLAAIERVEILKDGASAIYGTDAIGGVINFITRNDYTGAEVTAMYGETHQGGGMRKKGTAAAGIGDINRDRFNLFITADYEKEGAIKAASRKYASTAFIPGEGYNRLSSNAFPANVLLPSGALASPNSPTCLAPVSFATPVGDPRCRFDYASVIDIQPPSERTNFMARASFKVSDALQFFGEAAYNENKFTFAVSPSPISAQTTFSGVSLLLPVTSPFYPTAFAAANGLAGQPLDIFYRSVEGGPRTNMTVSEATRFLIGAKGTIGTWDYETAFMRSESKVRDSYTSGWYKESVFLPNFATGNINPFGPNNAAGLALLRAAEINQEIRHGRGTTTVVDGKASSELFQMPAGPVGFAAGFEYKKEKMDQISEPILNSGDILGSGGNIPSQSADRDVKAVFAEVRIPIIRNLDVSAAVRYDKYSDFGNTTNPKFTVEYRPTRQVLLRGSAGTGFRAPSLPELYTPLAQSNTGGVYDDPLRCPTTGNTATDCGLQFNTQQGGNPALKPEKSDQFTLGMVLQPTDNISVSMDYFNIKLKDQIGFISDITIFADFNQYAGQYIVRGPVDPKFPNLPGPIKYVLLPYSNLGETRTSGVDVDFKSKFPLGFGNLSVNMVGTYVWKYDTQNTDGTFSSNVGLAAAPYGAIPRWRHNLAFSVDAGPWSGTLAQNYQLHYVDQNANAAGNPRRVSSYETYDLQLAHKGLIKGLTMRVGVRNLFDRDPPFSNQNSTFQVGYDPTYGDPHGRFVYGAVTYAFK